ncbi:ATP-binding protein [Nocardioides sp. AN3]
MSERPVTVDAVARRALATLVALPGVHRAGLALTEGAGRRLRFTASDRDGDVVDWCYIDAYDDVPLTAVVRSGRPIAGTLKELDERFPDFVGRQDGTATVALIAQPLAHLDSLVGGVVVYVDDAAGFQPQLQTAVLDVAAAAAEDLLRARPRARPASEQGEAGSGDTGVGDSGVVTGLRIEGATGVGLARRHLREMLRQQAVDEDTIDDAALCLSEITTNAVLHTGAASYVQVSVDEDEIRVAVRDEGSPLGHQPGLLDPDEALPVAGRGLQIVEALSSRWGSEPDDDGTTVWFVLELRTG